MSRTPPVFKRRQYSKTDMLQLVTPIQTVQILSQRPSREEPADQLRNAALRVVDQSLGALAAGALFRVDGRKQAENVTRLMTVILKDQEQPAVDLQASLVLNLLIGAVAIQRPTPLRSPVIALELLKQCNFGSPFDVEMAKRVMDIRDWNVAMQRLYLVRQS